MKSQCYLSTYVFSMYEDKIRAMEGYTIICRESVKCFFLFLIVKICKYAFLGK